MQNTGSANSLKHRYGKFVQELLPLGAMVLTIIFFTLISGGGLLAAKNLRTIINQLFPILLIALGAQFIMAHGSMDLSLGGSLGVSMLVGSLVLKNTGSVPLSITAIMVTSVGIAVINGGISSYLGLPAFLTSLCIMFILRGILEFAASIEIVKLDGMYGVYDNYVIKAVVLVIVVLVTLYLFNFTKIGKYNKIIGGNQMAAQFLGIPVARYKFIAYIITGVCVGIAAFFAMCRERYISADTASGMEFNIMVALIFGGMPLAGGARARFQNAIIGAIILTVLGNGMILWGLDTGQVALIRGLLFLTIVYLGYKKTKGPLPR